MPRTFIGVDVSQDHLDVHVRPAALRRRFANTADGIAELIAWVRPHAAERIVFESTGPYQKAAVGALLAEGLPAVVVNARQVRDFAKAMNYLAKTDTIDAAVIAHFAEVATTTVRPLESQEIRDLRELYDRRGQLVHMLAMEKNQRHSATVAQASAEVLKSIDKHIAYLEAQIHDLEATHGPARRKLAPPSGPATRSCRPSRASARRCRGRCWPTCRSWGPPAANASRRWSGWPRSTTTAATHTGQRHIRGGRSKVRVGPVPGGDRRHPALPAHEGVLRRAEGARQGLARRHHRRGPEDPGAGQRPDPRHDALPGARQTPFAKNP